MLFAIMVYNVYINISQIAFMDAIMSRYILCVRGGLSNEPMSAVVGRVINIPIIWGFVKAQEQRKRGGNSFLLGVVLPSG